MVRIQRMREFVNKESGSLEAKGALTRLKNDANDDSVKNDVQEMLTLLEQDGQVGVVQRSGMNNGKLFYLVTLPTTRSLLIRASCLVPLGGDSDVGDLPLKREDYCVHIKVIF